MTTRNQRLTAFLDEVDARALWIAETERTILTGYRVNGDTFVTHEYTDGNGWDILIPAHTGNRTDATLDAVRKYLGMGDKSSEVQRALDQKDAVLKHANERIAEAERHIAALEMERDKWREAAQAGNRALKDACDELDAAKGAGFRWHAADLDARVAAAIGEARAVLAKYPAATAARSTERKLRRALLLIGAQHPVWNKGLEEYDELVNGWLASARKAVGARGKDDDAKADWCSREAERMDAV